MLCDQAIVDVLNLADSQIALSPSVRSHCKWHRSQPKILSRSPGPRLPLSCGCIPCRDRRLVGRVQDLGGVCSLRHGAHGETHHPRRDPGHVTPSAAWQPGCPAGSVGPRMPRRIQQGLGEQCLGSSEWTETAEGSRAHRTPGWGPPLPCLCQDASGWLG